MSRFVANIFEKELKGNKHYQQKQYIPALDEVFKRVDEAIQSPEGQIELHKIRYGGELKEVG